MLKMAYLPPVLNENCVKTFSKGNGMEYGINDENEDMKIWFTASVEKKKSLKNSMWSGHGSLDILQSRIFKDSYLKSQVYSINLSLVNLCQLVSSTQRAMAKPAFKI